MKNVYLVQDNSILKNSILDSLQHDLERLAKAEQEPYMFSIVSDYTLLNPVNDIFLVEPSLRSELTELSEKFPLAISDVIDLSGYGKMDARLVLDQVIRLDKYGRPKNGRRIRNKISFSLLSTAKI